MKKVTKFFIFAMMLSVFAFNVSAGWVTLFEATPNTKVWYYHGDSFWDDQYDGYAKVRGADWKKVGAYWNYYSWTSITFDVQGDLTAVTAYSGGQSISTPVQRTVTAYDKWNNGPKTKALYNYGLSQVSGNVFPDYVETLD